MNKFRKFITASVLLSLSAGFASALEYGAIITNNTKFTGNAMKERTVSQKDSGSLWFKVPFDDEGKTSLLAKGTYEYNYNNFYKGRDRFINTVNLDILNFKYAKEIGNSTFDLSAGRFVYSDLSGIVFSQVADGLYARYASPIFEVSAYGAYTGLLNSHSVTILDRDGDARKQRWLYQCASKYAVCAATVSFPYLFLNQTLSLQGFGTFKLEDKTFYRHYGTVSLSGPLFPGAFYVVSSTFGMTNYDAGGFKSSNLSQAKLSYYPEFKNSSISLNGVYASGRQGKFRAFTGFTSNTAVYNQQEQEYTELIKGGIEASIKPLNMLLVSGSCDLVYTAEKRVRYSGIQYNASAMLQIFTDFTVGAEITQFLHKSHADMNQTIIQLKGTFTL